MSAFTLHYKNFFDSQKDKNIYKLLSSKIFCLPI
jgi:hypothetical protein